MQKFPVWHEKSTCNKWFVTWISLTFCLKKNPMSVKCQTSVSALVGDFSSFYNTGDYLKFS